MKAEIKYLYSPGINDLEGFSPDKDDFYFLLQVICGQKDSEGEKL